MRHYTAWRRARTRCRGKGGKCDPGFRVDRVWPYFEQRLQDEASPSDRWMGKDQLLGLRTGPFGKEQVEIKRAVGPMSMTPAPRSTFQRTAAVEERLQRLFHLEDRHTVQEPTPGHPVGEGRGSIPS